MAKSKKPRALKARAALFPPKLLNFMQTGWDTEYVDSEKLSPHPLVEHFRKRRQRLSAAFKNKLVIVEAGVEKARNADNVYPFRPDSNFYYLTGVKDSGAVLVLSPKPATSKSRHLHLLFTRLTTCKHGKDPSFFTDREHGEFWVGPRLTAGDMCTLYGVDKVYDLLQLPKYLKGQAQVKRAPKLAVQRFLAKQRLLKEPAEIAALESACEATRRGFIQMIKALPKATEEKHLEAVFLAEACRTGGGVGYPPIIAGGAHALILHWSKNSGVLKKSELVLIDAGVESPDLYTADITRTLPISGRFTREQRLIYDLVEKAHSEALQVIKPGQTLGDIYERAMLTLTRGLRELGILKVSTRVAVDPANKFYKRYTLHGVSHMLGLDVHDCTVSAGKNVYNLQTILVPGMVLTLEPGLYLRAEDLTVPPEFRGIGIRLEDDILVTAKGYKILSNSIPRSSKALEKWMKAIWSGKSHV